MTRIYNAAIKTALGFAPCFVPVISRIGHNLDCFCRDTGYDGMQSTLGHLGMIVLVLHLVRCLAGPHTWIQCYDTLTRSSIARPGVIVTVMMRTYSTYATSWHYLMYECPMFWFRVDSWTFLINILKTLCFERVQMFQNPFLMDILLHRCTLVWLHVLLHCWWVFILCMMMYIMPGRDQCSGQCLTPCPVVSGVCSRRTAFRSVRLPSKQELSNSIQWENISFIASQPYLVSSDISATEWAL